MVATTSKVVLPFNVPIALEDGTPSPFFVVQLKRLLDEKASVAAAANAAQATASGAVPIGTVAAHLIAELVAPITDKILYYDNTTHGFKWLGLGTNLSITANTLNAAGGGGGGGAAPTVRAFKHYASSANSYAVTWPTGTVAGDVVFIIAHHGWVWTNPTGWKILANITGTNTNGLLCCKLMTSADIVAGGVTLTTSGVFDGSILLFTITGTTLNGIFDFAAAQSGSSSTTWTFNQPRSNDSYLNLLYIGTRSNSTYTWSANMTPVDTGAAANASFGLAKQSTNVQIGLSETVTASVGGTSWMVYLALR